MAVCITPMMEGAGTGDATLCQLTATRRSPPALGLSFSHRGCMGAPSSWHSTVLPHTKLGRAGSHSPHLPETFKQVPGTGFLSSLKTHSFNLWVSKNLSFLITTQAIPEPSGLHKKARRYDVSRTRWVRSPYLTALQALLCPSTMLEGSLQWSSPLACKDFLPALLMNSALLQKPLPSRKERAFNGISLQLESFSSNMDEALKMPLRQIRRKGGQDLTRRRLLSWHVTAGRGMQVLKALSANGMVTKAGVCSRKPSWDFSLSAS